MDGDSTLNDIDRIMSLEPPLNAVDIDMVIEWHRKQRARRASGDKTTHPKVDLSAILKMPQKAAPKVERRD